MIFEKSHSPYSAPVHGFREVKGRTSVGAFILGMAMIVSSILLGRTYTFFVSFLTFSILMTLLWRKAQRPLVYLTSISASVPITVSRKELSCNLIFALWIALFNMKYIFRLPKWIYVPSALVLIGFLTSSISWIFVNPLENLMKQGMFLYTFFLGPLLLLPVVYLRMNESRDHVANLKGLLFFLIVPSTLILISAKLFGSVANAWEASMHASSLAAGYLEYSLGKVTVDFSRTGVGFILAALICASTAIAISQVKVLYRLLAGACLVSNVFLLLATGSFGSITSSFCGLAAIFYTQSRKVNIAKVLLLVAILCCTQLLIYSFLPPSVKGYLEKRYEHRVVNADTDRLKLWALALNYFLENPCGVGLTYTVGDIVKSNPHNEYLVYAVSYGIIGGLAYPFLVLKLLIYYFKNRKRMIYDNSALAITLAGQGVIVALAVNSMTDHVGFNRWYFNAIWSLIWYTYFCSRAAQMDGTDK